ncbi:MAG: dynamin family protein, partial [Muribaculaceae bacterium]|nr:dynamin family protein [Muribaculaceae bacterium]
PDLRIPTADLGKYIVIDHTNRSDEDTQNPYSKVFIRYPLDVCRNGVMFVDSPGLDDPTCHDEITADYLPNADAIIYCMNIQNAYSAKDAMEIERLRNLGYTSIVFVFTYFDCIEANDRMMGTDQARATRDHYLAQTEGLTDMGRDGIFFVGSLPALAAKINKNQALLDSSYLPAVEKRLERLLFQEKGHMKLMRAVGAARNAGREVNQRVADLTELASNDRAHLNDRVNAAQTILNNARAKADNIGRQFSIGIGSIANESKDMVRAFLALEILPSIERYLDDFQPSEEANISFMHPKRTSRKYTEECIVHIQGKIESAFGAWIRDRLVGEFLEPRLRSLLAQQEGNIKALQTDLSQIRAELKIGTGVDEVGDQNDSLFNRVGAAIVGCFVGGPIIGATLGWAGIGGAIIGQIVGLIVGVIVAMFTPAGWATAIITGLAVIGGFIGGDVAGSMKIAGRINKKVVEKVKDTLISNQEKIVRDIADKLGESFGEITESVESTISAPVSQAQSLLDEAMRVAGEGEAQLKARLAQYSRIRKENAVVADELDRLAQEV